jgi:hypothetical protein
MEVFVHSHSKDIDVGHYREMSYHWNAAWLNGPMENWLGSLGVEYSVKNVRGFASGFGDGEKTGK